MLQADRQNKKLSNTSRAEKGSKNQYNQSSSHTSYPNPSFISGSPETYTKCVRSNTLEKRGPDLQLLQCLIQDRSGYVQMPLIHMWRDLPGISGNSRNPSRRFFVIQKLPPVRLNWIFPDGGLWVLEVNVHPTEPKYHPCQKI
ncbi:uncharacterized protein BDR25DRAFT_351603 [Lindgomyces ingoldianus]|uniref:Uncharacterized protein n=1 Tax=Lindgomyces ingoldianus TaxID=673940 RepID=A0ACB6R5G0_9PLEO|nr:uncharacterized protein BDR25DRAFT_351603 [Lindgomyces ingoldianus]KAF2474068.1 hypothetical protein BDR25DRAFT_351603 [Lindgomyces ingoldianus]